MAAGTASGMVTAAGAVAGGGAGAGANAGTGAGAGAGARAGAEAAAGGADAGAGVGAGELWPSNAARFIIPGGKLGAGGGSPGAYRCCRVASAMWLTVLPGNGKSCSAAGGASDTDTGAMWRLIWSAIVACANKRYWRLNTHNKQGTNDNQPPDA